MSERQTVYQANPLERPADRADLLLDKANDALIGVRKALWPIGYKPGTYGAKPPQYDEQAARDAVAKMLQVAHDLEAFVLSVEGQIPPPADPATEEAIKVELARLPARYAPLEIKYYAGEGYTLMIAQNGICRYASAAEALERAKRYVAEHERAGFRMPTGVINGQYD